MTNLKCCTYIRLFLISITFSSKDENQKLVDDANNSPTLTKVKEIKIDLPQKKGALKFGWIKGVLVGDNILISIICFLQF